MKKSLENPTKKALFPGRTDQAYLILFMMLGLVAMPDYAEAQSLGHMMCTVSHNIAPFEKLFVGIAYIMGAILIGSGLYQMSYFTDSLASARQYGVSRPKGYIISGAGLLAMPAFIGWSVRTIFGRSADLGNGISSCDVVVDAGGQAGNVGLDGLMTNMIYNIKDPLTTMLSVLCVLLGIYMVMRGLMKASRFGQDQKSSIPAIFANIIIGTIIYTIGTSMNEIMATVFGDSGVWGSGVVMNAIASDFDGNVQPFQQAVYAALTFFQLVGFIAFIRGWIILRDSVESGGNGQATVARGLTHILGGVLAVNIYRFLDIMDTTFGTGFL